MIKHILGANLVKNAVFGTPSWFFAKNQHIESSHVNFDDIFGFCTKFRIRNHCLIKKVVIYPTLAIGREAFWLVLTPLFSIN